jgi:hypothetical protein
LDYLFNNGSPAGITNIYVSLHTADPGEDGQGAGEVSGGSYARVSTAPADWDAASGADPATLENTSLITFPTATGSWGTVTHAGLWTHATTTTESVFVGATPLGASRTIASGETAEVAIGAIVATAD